jgi:hypothetical protein
MSTTEHLRAMTTNERLLSTGQMVAFDNARARGDLAEARKILESVYLSEFVIARILADIAATHDRLP